MEAQLSLQVREGPKQAWRPQSEQAQVTGAPSHAPALQLQRAQSYLATFITVSSVDDAQ